MADDSDGVEELLGRLSTAQELSDKIKSGDFVFVTWRDDGSCGGGWLGDVEYEDVRWARICLDELEAALDEAVFGVEDE